MRLNHGRLLIGIVLVLLGVLLILERAGMVVGSASCANVGRAMPASLRSEEHTSELQSH